MTIDWAVLQPAIVAAAAGDGAARERLVATCLPEVRALVHRELQQDFRQRHRWILPLFSTQDVVHEVLVAVVADLADTQFAGPGPFCAYLGTLVQHRLLDAVRFHEAARRDGRRQVAEPTAGLGGVAADPREATPTLAASLGERASLVRDALGELPERQRRLLELRLLDDATFPQIRAALGYASDETARQAFLDAQAKLLVKLRVRGFGKTLTG
ncbi:MAG: sigma-70 family RNA polymerase sigma factor [Planctomycetes bacterium]|nr:sigma-70 family RNA polymerase sigma factor [Planctomycetota bacterium]